MIRAEPSLVVLVKVASASSKGDAGDVEIEVLAVVLEKLGEEQADVVRRVDLAGLDLGMKLRGGKGSAPDRSRQRQ